MVGIRLPWLKLHTRARNDRKLDALTDRQFRLWFRLLCYAAEGEPRGCFIADEITRLEVRGSKRKFLADLERMKELRLLDQEGYWWNFRAWSEAQYDKPSDHPNATSSRKAKQRERQRAADQQEVTPGHAMSRVEKEKEEETDREPQTPEVTPSPAGPNGPASGDGYTLTVAAERAAIPRP